MIGKTTVEHFVITDKPVIDRQVTSRQAPITPTIIRSGLLHSKEQYKGTFFIKNEDAEFQEAPYDFVVSRIIAKPGFREKDTTILEGNLTLTLKKSIKPLDAERDSMGIDTVKLNMKVNNGYCAIYENPYAFIANSFTITDIELNGPVELFFEGFFVGNY